MACMQNRSPYYQMMDIAPLCIAPCIRFVKSRRKTNKKIELKALPNLRNPFENQCDLLEIVNYQGSYWLNAPFESGRFFSFLGRPEPDFFFT